MKPTLPVTIMAPVSPSSPGSSLSARLGMSSAVHQAETSDKTFDDVIGIDEAKADLQVRVTVRVRVRFV